MAGPTLEEHDNFDSPKATLPLPGLRHGTALFRSRRLASKVGRERQRASLGGPKARAGPGLARLGKPVPSEDGGVVAASRPRQCVGCSPSLIACLTLEPCHAVAGLHPQPTSVAVELGDRVRNARGWPLSQG